MIECDANRGTIALGLMRIVLGFMLVWAFFDKLFGFGMLTTEDAAIVNGGSPTEYYLSELVSGPLEGIYQSLAGNAFLDFMLMAGLILVGAALMLGVASKLSTVGMVVMMLLMYSLHIPPQDNPLFSYHIVYILGIVAIYYLGGFGVLGLKDRWDGTSLVRRFPVLS